MAAGFSTASDFAKKARVADGTYRHHENGTGGRGLPSTKLELYARLLNVSVDWLLSGDSGDEEKQPKSVSRRNVSSIIRLSKFELENLSCPVDLAALGFLNDKNRERVLVPIDAANAAAIHMSDDSMSRVITPGESLVVNFDDTDLTDGSIYLISNGNGPIVRRYRNLDDRRWFEADSFQGDYGPIDSDDIEGIMGRVVWRFAKV